MGIFSNSGLHFSWDGGITWYDASRMNRETLLVWKDYSKNVRCTNDSTAPAPAFFFLRNARELCFISLREQLLHLIWITINSAWLCLALMCWKYVRRHNMHNSWQHSSWNLNVIWITMQFTWAWLAGNLFANWKLAHKYFYLCLTLAINSFFSCLLWIRALFTAEVYANANSHNIVQES